MDLLTPEQLAERRCCKKEKLAMDRYHRRGTPYIKFGHKTIRYRMVDVLAEEEQLLIQTKPLEAA